MKPAPVPLLTATAFHCRPILNHRTRVVGDGWRSTYANRRGLSGSTSYRSATFESNSDCVYEVVRRERLMREQRLGLH